jgi:hypothetical protein
VRERRVEITLDVREHPEVLLDAPSEQVVAAREVERAEIQGPGRLQRAAIQFEAAQRVERFGSEVRGAEPERPSQAALARLARPYGLALPVMHDGKAPQRLDGERLVAFGLGRADHRRVAVRRLVQAAVFVLPHRRGEQLAGQGRPRRGRCDGGPRHPAAILGCCTGLHAAHIGSFGRDRTGSITGFAPHLGEARPGQMCNWCTRPFLNRAPRQPPGASRRPVQ